MFVNVPGPAWSKWLRFTPVRWLPSKQVYWSGIQFDEAVAQLYPRCYTVYHSFPGFAEMTFRKVKERDGIAVLEAATTHVEELYRITEEEHRKYGMGGSPFSRPWVNRVLREYELADYITVASRLQYDSFLRQGVPAEKLIYAPLGIDTSRFRPLADLSGSDAAATAEEDGVFRIIQVGQISLRKGFLYLLDAVEKIGDPMIEVVLYGGIGWRGIREAIARYQQRGVRIICRSGDPLPALQRAHLCVHSSIEDGFGLAPLEAMAAGLPAVVTDMTGMKDLIQEGINGYVVPSRDANALAERIAVLKANEPLRRQMGQAARASALLYDSELCAKTYAEALLPVWKAV